MRTTIDRAGRLVVPKQLRDRLALDESRAVDLVEHDGAIEIRPAPVDATVVPTPEGPVAASREPIRALTDADVRETAERLRR